MVYFLFLSTCRTYCRYFYYSCMCNSCRISIDNNERGRVCTPLIVIINLRYVRFFFKKKIQRNNLVKTTIDFYLLFRETTFGYAIGYYIIILCSLFCVLLSESLLCTYFYRRYYNIINIIIS